MITYSAVPEIWHMTNVIIFHFGLIVALFTPKSSKNQNFKKIKKTEIWCATDRQTDGQKSDILVSAKNEKKRQENKNSFKTT